MQKTNAFLDLVMRQARASRPLITADFSIRVESVRRVPFVSIWFRTQGCTFDHRGGCIMCNYGCGAEFSAEGMVSAVKEALDSLQSRPEANGGQGFTLLVSPSGSMFDETEVPPAARRGIFDLVRKSGCISFICETRAATVTHDRIKECVEILYNKRVLIEMGLESADPWILKYCINKAMVPDEFKRAVAVSQAHRVPTIANVLLGTPFLSDEERISDAANTVRWALASGTEGAVVFPVHVKRWTLVHWLWEHGLYEPPSLWSLVEVLLRLGPDLGSRVTISWYKRYDRSSNIVLSSPSTCSYCEATVLNALDAYRDSYEYKYLSDLQGLRCECKERWHEQLTLQTSANRRARVARAYETIGIGILGASWWEHHGDQVLQSLEQDPVLSI